MRSIALVLGLIGMIVTSSASALPVVVQSIASGIDDSTGEKIPYSNSDDSYVIGPGSTEGVGLVPYTVNTDLVYSDHFFPDSESAESRWIAIDISHPESPYDAQPHIVQTGTYSFLTSVNLSGFDPGSAQIENVRFGADNQLIGVLVNGSSVFSESASEPRAEDFKTFHTLGTLGAGLMQAGLNEIEFKVYNARVNSQILANSMGFRVEGLLTANPIPEPTTALLLCIGLIGLGLNRRA